MPLPKVGTHEATITKAEEKTSKAGNKMIVVTLDLTDGHQITEYVVFTPAAEWKAEAVGDAIGIKATEELTPEAMQGKRVVVEVEHEDSEKYGAKARVRNWAKANEQTGTESEGEGDGEEDDSFG